MRVNVWAEELTERCEVLHKEVHGKMFIGIRLYLELPVTKNLGEGVVIHKGPFMMKHDRDNSAAITIWGENKSELLHVLANMHNKVAETSEKDHA